MLFVIGCIVLLSMIMYYFSGAATFIERKNKSEKISASMRCLNKMGYLGDMLYEFAQKNDGAYPNSIIDYYNSNKKSVINYTSSSTYDFRESKFLICPICINTKSPNKKQYMYIYSGKGKKISDSPPSVVLFEEEGAHCGYFNVFLSNGTVKCFDADEWEKFCKKNKFDYGVELKKANKLRLEEDSTRNNAVKKAKGVALDKIGQNKFSIVGEVVDEKGSPLNQVSLKVTKSINLGFLGSKQTSYLKTINSSFRVDAKNCNLLYLSFSKKGFYTQRKAFNADTLLKKQKIKDRNFKVNNVRITMLPIGEKAKTICRNTVLRLSPEKNMDLYNALTFEKSNTKINIKDINVPEHVFYLDVERDEKGRIKTFQYRGRKTPTKIFLHLKCENGDGMLVENKVNDIRALREAPISGYSRTPIVFSIKDRIHINKILFYYKAGEHYGKGIIAEASVSNTGRVGVFILIMKNLESSPDKNRTLSGDIL